MSLHTHTHTDTDTESSYNICVNDDVTHTETHVFITFYILSILIAFVKSLLTSRCKREN